jgi:flagellar motor protein MotB
MWVSVLVFVGIMMGGCVSQAKYLDLQKSYVERGEAVARANALLDEYHEKVSFLSVDLRAKETLLKKREEELALVSSVRKDYDDKVDSMKDDIDRYLQIFKKDEGVTYDKEKGALVLEGSVFFDSGSEKVKNASKKTLMKVASVLKSNPGDIQILGHSDSDPIVKTRSKWPLGNLQLSGARALNVLLFMKDKGGVNGKRMSFAGCGPNQPRVPNNSKSNKRMNRRVEILVKELTE